MRSGIDRLGVREARETGRNGRGRRVTAEAVDKPFVVVMADDGAG
jgi:hypothetical protein